MGVLAVLDFEIPCSRPVIPGTHPRSLLTQHDDQDQNYADLQDGGPGQNYRRACSRKHHKKLKEYTEKSPSDPSLKKPRNPQKSFNWNNEGEFFIS